MSVTGCEELKRWNVNAAVSQMGISLHHDSLGNIKLVDIQGSPANFFQFQT